MHEQVQTKKIIMILSTIIIYFRVSFGEDKKQSPNNPFAVMVQVTIIDIGTELHSSTHSTILSKHWVWVRTL